MQVAMNIFLETYIGKHFRLMFDFILHHPRRKREIQIITKKKTEQNDK